jgi:hypothetical protein
VAGLVAGATDNIDGFGNPVGYPSIGFNCRLDLSTNTDDDGMYDLSIHPAGIAGQVQVL